MYYTLAVVLAYVPLIILLKLSKLVATTGNRVTKYSPVASVPSHIRHKKIELSCNYLNFVTFQKFSMLAHLIRLDNKISEMALGTEPRFRTTLSNHILFYHPQNINRRP
jgi:hypothetical protein